MQKIFKVIFAVVVAFFILLPALSFSLFIIDYTGYRYEEVLSNFHKVEGLPLNGLIIGSPFKAYEKRKKEEIIYDFFDVGSVFQRGSLETYYGLERDFQNLTDFIKGKKLKIYAKVNLFTQKRGYKRSFWKNSDFYSRGVVYSDVYYLNLENMETRDKLDKIIRKLFSLPVDKWIVDIRNYPEPLKTKYYKYLLSQDTSRLYILLELKDINNKTDEVLSCEDYNFLREKVFVPQNCRFLLLKQFNFRNNGTIHFIQSDSLSINNFCVLAYLLAQNQDVVVPIDMLNHYGMQIVRFFAQGSKMKFNIFSDDKLVLYDESRIAAFNFGNSMCILKIENFWKKKGTYKSILGSSPLSFGERDVSIFMLPESFSFWDFK